MNTNNYRELLLGCGHRREKLLGPPNDDLKWKGLVTLDINERCQPDIICDLNIYADDFDSIKKRWHLQDWSQRSNQPIRIDTLIDTYTFKSESFDEIHAYELVEHLGQQGDARAFFNFFSEVWRILKPGGFFFSTSPSRYSPWLWGDPSHRRVFIPESTVFLSQQNYIDQCDGAIQTPMTDFRNIYKADFNVRDKIDNQRTFVCVLQAVKPSRWVKK